MESRIAMTLEKRKKGYNCAQAVACTYCDLVGVDEATMFRINEGLGAGMSTMDGTCGAVAAAGILAGMKNSTANLEKPDSKGSTMKLSKAIVEKFKAQNQSILCKDLKGVETGTMIRSCPDCITDAAALVEEILFSE